MGGGEAGVKVDVGLLRILVITVFRLHVILFFFIFWIRKIYVIYLIKLCTYVCKPYECKMAV